MNSFQRLIAIPREEYASLLNSQNQQGSLAQHMQGLEQRFKEEENVKDPYRQLVMQSDVLDQMINLKSQMRDSLAISTPKPYLNRAKALFRNMEAFLKFNDKGEIITNEDRVIPNSRIEDLIQHAVRDRRRNMTPTGWEYFLHLLREYNVPKTLLNRNTLDEIEGNNTTSNKLETIVKAVKQSPSLIPKIKTSKGTVSPATSLPRRISSRAKKVNTKFLQDY